MGGRIIWIFSHPFMGQIQNMQILVPEKLNDPEIFLIKLIIIKLKKI